MKGGLLFANILLLANYIQGIVLHSSLDIANEIHLMKQEMGAIKHENSVLKQEYEAIKKENMQLKASMKGFLTSMEGCVITDTSSTCVRWGRTMCSTNGTTLVYKGYMGGHHITDNSGGAEFLCLPHDVQWAQYGSSSSQDPRLYGAEYEMYTGTGQMNEDAPCCLCKTNRSTSVMIPARSTCFPGWTLEYTGYLAAGQRSYSHKNYVCIDAHPESRAGGNVNHDEAVVHNVQAQCGSLPCPPYVDSRQLACVVCSI